MRQLAGLALMLAMLTGCGKAKVDPTVPVSGSVQYRGKPVEGATVTLIPGDANLRSASGITDAEGQFNVMTYFGPTSQPKGAMPGEYTVTVRKMTAAEIPKGLGPQEEQAAFMKAGPPKSLLPKSYLTANTSKLKVKVEPDAEPIRLDLKD